MAENIKAIFLAALDTPTEQRLAYLERACGTDAEVRRRVEALLRAHEAPDRLLDSPAWRPTPEPAAAGADAAAEPPERAGRVHLLGEIARGGMGAVLRGHDPELGRELAVKVILPAHRGNPDLLRRFVGEARLAGQLQHPGIMPVYDLGKLDDGRPFFTMKLIQGRTLAALLAERAPGGANTPGSPQELPRLLRYFEAVCQAVGYAHAKGVIHRDLKPQNVMVGEFGEVQVMDWGLAKRLEEGAERGPEQPPPPPASPSATPLPLPLTRPGAVVGTPGYLAPEQARGRAGDQRADVFSLGAILCEILTGAPPSRGVGLLLEQGRAAESLLALRGAGASTHLSPLRAGLSDATARLERCGAEAELVRLAKDCLAEHPEGRPADGSAVAARVAEHLAGMQERLRRAEVGQARAEARAEGERTRRRLAVGLAAAVLTVVALGAGTLLLVQRHQAEQAREQARRQQAAKSALARSAELGQQGRWAEALAVLQQARQRLDEGDGPLSRDVRKAVAEVELVGRLEKVRLRAATMTGRSFARARARADREYESEFRAAGLGGPDEPAGAVAERVRASGVRTALVAALDAWAMTTEDRRRRDWARAVAARADQAGDWGRRLRASWADPAALGALAREAPVARLSPHLLGALADALGDRRAAVAFLRKAQMRHPGDFWLTFFLALRLHEEGQHAEAAGFYRAALAARPDTPAVLVNLGNVLSDQKKLDEACDCYRRAIELDPKDASPHNNLGNALKAKGQLGKAIGCFRKAIALDPKDPLPHYNLGLTWKARGEVDAAIACYQKAIALDPKYAKVYTGLGLAWKAKGKMDQAIACYKKAIELDSRDASPHVNLGNALKAEGQVEQAIGCFRKALAIDPKDAMPHYNLGTTLLNAKGQVDEAIHHFRKAIAIDRNFPEAHCNLGHALVRRGDFTEALGSLRRGHELGSKRGDWKDDSGAWVRDCERLIEREKNLLGLGGSSKPADARERIAWARFYVQTRRYVLAARLSGEAFGADEKLANDLAAGHRYRAAVAAALAGLGQGRDAGKLTGEARAALRKQALDWLKADLAAWRSHKDGTKRARALRHWQADRALAEVRDKEGLAKLPPAERTGWAGLWAEVEKLLKPAP
jgi:serine/threonine-protein kinase